jgi:glutathione S-transferase
LWRSCNQGIFDDFWLVLQILNLERSKEMFTFYYTPHTCSLASHIALKDAGARYELKRIDFGLNEQQSPEYMKINPKARVPALVTSRGTLTETPAILAFIAQTFPQAALAPLNDPFAFAELQSISSYLCSTLHVAHSHRMRGYRWASDASSFTDMQRKVPESVGACYDIIESRMLRGPWVMGETYTIADPYLFTIAQWLEDDGVDSRRIPRVIEHRFRVAERANVKSAIAEEQAIMIRGDPCTFGPPT